MIAIDARGLHYQTLNQKIHEALQCGETEILLKGVNGQRYIGVGLKGPKVRIRVHGVPGNDLGAFMDGPTIDVHSNAQDGIGNTMNRGKIIVHGDAGDIVGYAMRGGKIYIRGNAGYRVGIHMKAFNSLFPVIIIGGRAGNFLGEYMAGGMIVVLGLNGHDQSPLGTYVGTGMHAGKIYVRGYVRNFQLGKEIKVFDVTQDDLQELEPILEEYCQEFDLIRKDLWKTPFVKLFPYSHRPYGKLYAY